MYFLFVKLKKKKKTGERKTKNNETNLWLVKLDWFRLKISSRKINDGPSLESKN